MSVNFSFGLLALISSQWLVDLVIGAERSGEYARGRSWPKLAAHGFAHGFAFYLLFGDLAAWPLALWIVLTHSLLDAIESRFAGGGTGWFFAGQAMHLALSYSGALLLAETVMPNVGSGWSAWIGERAIDLQLIIAGGLAATYLGAELVGALVGPLQAQFEPRQDRTASAQGDRSDRPDRGFKEGGRLIGLLERGLIFLLTLIGQTAGIGFLVAAKSIFRFGELRQRANRLEAEYILIGTLASFLWGLVVAVLIRYMLALN